MRFVHRIGVGGVSQMWLSPQFEKNCSSVEFLPKSPWKSPVCNTKILPSGVISKQASCWHWHLCKNQNKKPCKGKPTPFSQPQQAAQWTHLVPKRTLRPWNTCFAFFRAALLLVLYFPGNTLQKYTACRFQPLAFASTQQLLQFPIPRLGSLLHISCQGLTQLKSLFPVLQSESQAFNFLLIFSGAEYFQYPCGFLENLTKFRCDGQQPTKFKIAILHGGCSTCGSQWFPWGAEQVFDCLPYSKYAHCPLFILITSLSICLKYHWLYWQCRMWARCCA